MKMTIAIGLVTLASCASTRSGQAATPPRLEVSCLSYNRRTLVLRVLVEATSDNTALDRRMTPNASAGIKSPVKDCKTERPVKYFLADYFPAKANYDDLVILRDGEFFGRTMSFELFMDEGPECIATSLVFTMTGSMPLAQI